MMAKNYRHPRISTRLWTRCVDERGEFWDIAFPNCRHVLVDVSDTDYLANHHWFIFTLRSHNNPIPYLARSNDGVSFLHRELMAPPSDLQVDHIDGNGINDRRYNMRLATAHQNNSTSPNSLRGVSGRRGVYPDGNGGWYSLIRLNYKAHYLGRFTDPDDAARAYDTAAIAARGEFTQLNFPRE